MQLPAFSLSSHLSDRQQASSVNLKPSEVRLTQSRPDTGPGPVEPSSPTQQGLRGILKKSSSGGPEWSRTDAPFSHEQNGGGCEEEATRGRVESTERQDIPVPPRRERRGEGGSLTAAPWRQRARTRRETIACTPTRAWSEQDALQEERNSWTKPQEQLVSAVESSSDAAERVQ